MKGLSNSGFRAWRGLDRPTATAMLGSALMIAQAVAAKTLRDSVFLSAFPVSALPLMTFVAAAVAIGASVAGSRLAGWISPGVLVPGAFVLSGALQIGEYVLYGENAGAAAIAIFLHVFSLNLILTSSFWSLMSEHFDPRSAQKAFGRIAGMGTVGGILGGLLAERTAAWGSVPLLMLFAAGLHFACGLTMWAFASKSRASPHSEPAERPEVIEVLARSPFLLQLAMLVVTVSVAAGLVDFLFKSQAIESIGKGAALTQFFAWFQITVAIFGVAVQMLVTPAILSRLGPAIPVRILPAALLAGGGIVCALFSFAGIALLRGLEMVLRGSMFRSGYELFYTPVAAEDKRAVKGIIDVTGERLGDILGSGLVGLLLWLSATRPVILLTSVACAGLALLMARRLEQAYLKALEKSLARQSRSLNQPEEQALSQISFVAGASGTLGRFGAAEEWSAPLPPAVLQLMNLRSANDSVVRRALLEIHDLDPVLCPQLIQLLAHDSCAFLAMEKLRGVSSRHAGQLADALLNPGERNIIRRRIPLILAGSRSQIALDALTEALRDEAFQIRFRSAHAIRQLLKDRPALVFDADRVWDALAAELQVDRKEWDGRKMVAGSSSSHENPGDASVEYLFALLRLLLPAEPVAQAYRALGTEDRHLRGTALEYLQTALPSATWKQVEALIADRLVKPRQARA